MTDTLMVGVSGIRGIVGKDLTEEIVARYAKAFGLWAKERKALVVTGRDARESGPAFERGAVERHLDAVLELSAVDVERIRKRKFTIALDAVRGAGGPVMRALLERLGCEVAGINLETDGRFPRAPEPVPENLGGLSTLVKHAGAALGIAVDPDVDRLAIVDESGTPIGEDYTLAFAVRAVLGGPADGGTGGPKTQSPSTRPAVRPSVVCNLSTSLVV